MSRKVFYVGLVALGSLYVGLDRINERLDSQLQNIAFHPPQMNSVAINTREFNLVQTAGLDQSAGQISGQDINEAFYKEPPKPKVTATPVVKPPIVTAPVAPEPPPIEPINFLERHKDQFRLDAILPEQKMAVINGKVFREGEAMDAIGFAVPYKNEEGLETGRFLMPVLASIRPDGVRLDASHPRGWEQAVKLQLSE